MKRLLSLVCALLMFASLATPAFAADAPPAEDPALVDEPLPPEDAPAEEEPPEEAPPAGEPAEEAPPAEEEAAAQDEEPPEEENRPTEEPAEGITGSGTDGDAYTLTTAAHLEWLADVVNSGAGGAQGSPTTYYRDQGVYYQLGRDIDLSTIANWTPIGTTVVNEDRAMVSWPFRANFDGNGYEISNLNQSITAGNQQHAGLFGFVEFANITNVVLRSGSINLNVGAVSLHDPVGNKDYSYTYNAGALVGEAVGSEITKCHNYGVTVTTGVEPAGGLVGWLHASGSDILDPDTNSVVTFSSNHARVQSTATGTATTYVGGIVGHGQNAGKLTAYGIERSANYGDITGAGAKAHVGGIIGWANSTTVYNSLNTGTITGGLAVGGIAGSAAKLGLYNFEIENCYSTGNVLTKHADHRLGGIAGFTTETGSITNCVALGVNIGRHVAGATVKTTVGRILGLRSSTTTVENVNNHAYQFMLCNWLTKGWAADGSSSTTLNGASQTNAALRGTAFWSETALFDTEIWQLSADTLPKLVDVPGPAGGATMPDYPEPPARIIEPRINGSVLAEMDYDAGGSGWVFTLQWKDTLGNVVDAGNIQWALDDGGTGGASLAKTITEVKSGSTVVGQKRSLTIAPNWTGTATVTVTEKKTGEDEPVFTQSFTINITPASATGIALEPASLRVAPGSTFTVDVVSTPASSRLEDNDWVKTAEWTLEPNGPDDPIIAEINLDESNNTTCNLTAKTTEGTVTLKVTGKLNGVEKTASCTITVAPRLTGIKLLPEDPVNMFVGDSLQFTAVPEPANALLPEDLEFFVPAGGETIAKLDADVDGLLHAIDAGTTIVNAEGHLADGTEISSPNRAISVNKVPTQLNLQLDDTEPSTGATTTDLTTRSTEELGFYPTIGCILNVEMQLNVAIPATAFDSTWTSDNPAVLRLWQARPHSASFEIRAAGTANITVNYAGKITRSLRVVVPPVTTGAATTLAFGQSRVQVPQSSASFTLPLAYNGSAGNLSFAWLPANGDSPLADSAVGVSEVKYDEDAGMLVVSAASPGDFVAGEYDLYVGTESRPIETLITKCRVDIVASGNFATTAQEAASYRLPATSATLLLNATSSAVRLPLTVGTNGKPANLDLTLGDSYLVFTPNNANHAGMFTVEAAGNNAFTVDFAGGPETRRDLPKSSTGKLEIWYSGAPGPDTLLATVKESLTIKVDSRKYLTLKAPALNVNCFYATEDDDNGDITVTMDYADITGGEVTALEWNGSKKPNYPGWFSTVSLDNSAKKIVITMPKATKKMSGTMYLMATVDGWEGDKAPLAVKVSRSHVAPSLKLSTTAPKIYLGDDTAGTPMTLKAKSSKQSLLTLGVIGITVAPDTGLNTEVYKNQGNFEVSSLNRTTGAFTLSQKSGSTWEDNTTLAKMKNTRLMLQVQVYDYATGDTRSHNMEVKVSPIAATTKVSLKASKTSLTLNPNLPAGESFDIALSTNIAGYQLANRGAGKNLAVQVLDSKAKNTPNPDETPINAYLMGTTLRVYADHGTEDWAYGKTFKVKLTLPKAYEDSKGNEKDATLTLTVKTQKKTDARKNYTPTLKLGVKGKLNLTTGAFATLNLTISNYNGSLPVNPTLKDDFTVNRVVGKTLVPVSNTDKESFSLVRLSEKSWQLSARPASELNADNYLLPGKYTFQLKANLQTGLELTSNVATVTVQASKPKLALTPKAATLYRSDADSFALVRISAPAGSGLMVAEAAPQRADNAPYTVEDFGGGYVMVRFKTVAGDADATENMRLGARKKVITLNVWMDGIRAEDPYAGDTPVATKATTTVKLTIDPKL